MSELVITNKKETLQTLFTKIKEVYYDPSTTFTPSNLATMTYELPYFE
jgi:hypothetical protein